MATAGNVQARVTIVHSDLVDGDVHLFPLPPGYTPQVKASRALDLGLRQFSHPAATSGARLYLGEFRVHGTPQSAVPRVGSPGQRPCSVVRPRKWPAPMPGQASPRPYPTGTCRFGVVMNADTGSLVVEGPI